MVGCFSSLRRSKSDGPDPDDPRAQPSEKGSRRSKNSKPPSSPGLFSGRTSRSSARTKTPLPPAYSVFGNVDSGHDSAINTLEEYLDHQSADLRELSLAVHDHPELAYEEYKTRDSLVNFLRSKVGKDNAYSIKTGVNGLPTAWTITFTHGSGGRKVGFQSEMDALPKIGHACGHNLIAITGVGAFLSLAAAMTRHDISGTLILMGTPAEETSGGKTVMLKDGAYDGLDACLMLHPAPYGGLGEMLAVSQVEVQYFGHGSHAAGAPWEGKNALDAAVIAYNAISSLRQQLHPTWRVHGIIKSDNTWVQNVIPDHSTMVFAVRTPKSEDMAGLKDRVSACFQSGASATGCTVDIKWEFTYDDVVQNGPLGEAYTKYLTSRHNFKFPETIPALGSTDFGNVSHALPSVHPMFEIPLTGPGNGNHTPGFTDAARTEESHVQTIMTTKGIAVAGLRVLMDEEFARNVRADFEKTKASRQTTSLWSSEASSSKKKQA